MKFLNQILIFQLMATAFGQNITQTDPNITANEVQFDDERPHTEDLGSSEAIPPPVRHDLDHSLHTLVDSGKDFLLETRRLFNEELNGTHAESNAKEIWIAYSKSWGRVFSALSKELIDKVMSSDGNDLDISMDCLLSMMDVLTGLKLQKNWAVNLFDSSGRPFPEGSLDGTITSLGAYDQCLAIERRAEDGEVPDFVGQYCIMKYKMALPPKPEKLTLRSRVFDFKNTPVEGTFLEEFSSLAHAFYDRWGRTGVCIPSTCTQKDFNLIVKLSVSERHLNLTVNDCHTKMLPKLDSLQTTIVVVFGVIFCLMVLATSLDLVIIYTKDPEQFRFIRVESPIRKLMVSTLLSFSVYSNGKILFGDSGGAQSQIKCLNGIRVISMVWILWTHTYLISIKETFSFVKEFMYAVEELGFQLILNGWVLVDTFFLIGAMLTTYSNFHRLTRNNGQINIVQQIMSRFFRIWPSLCLTVGLIFLIPSLSSGPLWREYFDIQFDKCHKNWWTTITFINNWFDESQMCLLHTWYLSADFQLFLIAFLFILPLYKKPSLGIKLIILTIMGSALAIGIRTYLLKQNPTVLYNTPNERDVYDQTSTIYVHTYIHLGPYFVGLILGYLVFKHKSLTISPLLNLGIWLIAMCGCMTIMLSTYSLNRGQEWHPLMGASYAGLHRIGWSLCIAWIIFGCSTGNGGPINTFLSWNFFVPLGRLSFMIYLMHFLVIWVRYAYGRQPLPFSHYTMFCQFIVNLVISTGVSIVTHLAVEAPILSLYRIYLSNKLKFLAFNLRQEPIKELKESDKHLSDSGIMITSKL